MLQKTAAVFRNRRSVGCEPGLHSISNERPMARVLITDNLSEAGLKLLRSTPGIEVDVRSGLTPEQVREALREADGIIIRIATKLTAALLEGQKRLKVIV